MTDANLAPFVEHSVLRPEMRLAEVDAACDAALLYRFRGIVVPSSAVAHAKRRLIDTGINVVAVVSFPHGTSAPDVKAHEAMRASAMGADELDYVISIGAALDEDWHYLHQEATAIIRQTRGKILKAILETGALPNDEIKIQAALTVVAAGVPYVKTCTGFGAGVATTDDVSLLAQTLAGKALVKASGGIHTRAQALALLQAGAAVVGTSRGPQICTGD